MRLCPPAGALQFKQDVGYGGMFLFMSLGFGGGNISNFNFLKIRFVVCIQ